MGPSRKKWYALLGAALLFLAILLLLSGRQPLAQTGSQSSSSGSVANGMREVTVYFSNPTIEEDPCRIYPVPRQIEDNPTFIRETMEALLAGPTDEEKKKGYDTNLGDGAKLRSLTAQGNLANVDLQVPAPISASEHCKMDPLYAEIKATLSQFSPIDSVVVSFNGTLQSRDGFRE